MKKLWVIAMAFVSTMALAQHNQKQTTTSTGSQSSQKAQLKTSQSYFSNEGTIDGASYKITFTAKAATPDKNKNQSGMNSPEKMNNTHQKETKGTPSIGTSNTTNNQNPAETQGTGVTDQTATSMKNNSGTASSQSPESNNNTGDISKTGSNVSSGQPESENQNMGNTPGSQNQPGQSGSYANQNSILGNPANTDYLSLDGKTMVVTFKNGKIEFSDKGKLSDSGNRPNSKSEPDMAMPNTNATSDNIQSESCEYHKTSGNGSLCTLTASCTGTGSEKLYWSAYIDGSKIKGSVLTTGGSDYTFTGKRISVSGSKKTSKETSQR
jgi:hypothetical protein